MKKSTKILKNLGAGIIGVYLITGINSSISAQLINGAESFDNFPFINDVVYDTTANGSASDDIITLSSVAKADAFEGNGAASFEYAVKADQSWGGQTAFTMYALPNTTWDWTGDTALSIYYNNTVAQLLTGRAHLRIEIYDAHDTTSDVKSSGCEVWYSFMYILDSLPGWKHLLIPLKDTGSNAQVAPGGNGFQLTGWYGVTRNSVFDLDKIRGINFEIAQSSPNDNVPNSGTILVDKLILEPLGSLPSSIKNTLTENGYVYPNPVSDIIYFKNLTNLASIEVINITGQVVLKKSSQKITSIDLTSLKSGVYYLNCFTASGKNY